MLILLTEAAFIIAELVFVLNDHDKRIVDIFQVLDLVFSAYYCVEVSLRIIGNGYVDLVSGRGIIRWVGLCTVKWLVAYGQKQLLCVCSYDLQTGV